MLNRHIHVHAQDFIIRRGQSQKDKPTCSGVLFIQKTHKTAGVEDDTISKDSI